MRSLQGSFARLRIPMEIQGDGARSDILEICVRLHNIRSRLVGISQIRNVYEPLWRSGDDELYFDFEDILYGDMRRRDRLSRFYRM